MKVKCPSAIFMLALASVLLGVGPMLPHGSQPAIPRLQGMSNDAIDSAVYRVVDLRRKTASALLGQLKQPGLGNRPEAAIVHLLGVLRQGVAAPALMERIAFVTKIGPRTRIRLAALWGARPSVSSLISIGMPSVRAILKLLPHEPNALRRRLMVKVLVGVEGRAVTRFRLRRLVAKAATAHEKVNLKAALADVAQVKGR